jgi:predicted lipoprotein
MLTVERKRDKMKDKMTSLALALGLVLLCGVAGAVEAEAKPKPLALEVVSQTWHDLPQAKQARYCDTRNAKRIVRAHHSGATPKGKHELRAAYRLWLRDC